VVGKGTGPQSAMRALLIDGPTLGLLVLVVFDRVAVEKGLDSSKTTEQRGMT